MSLEPTVVEMATPTTLPPDLPVAQNLFRYRQDGGTKQLLARPPPALPEDNRPLGVGGLAGRFRPQLAPAHLLCGEPMVSLGECEDKRPAPSAWRSPERLSTTIELVKSAGNYHVVVDGIQHGGGPDQAQNKLWLPRFHEQQTERGFNRKNPQKQTHVECAPCFVSARLEDGELPPERVQFGVWQRMYSDNTLVHEERVETHLLTPSSFSSLKRNVLVTAYPATFTEPPSLGIVDNDSERRNLVAQQKTERAKDKKDSGVFFLQKRAFRRLVSRARAIFKEPAAKGKLYRATMQDWQKLLERVKQTSLNVKAKASGVEGGIDAQLASPGLLELLEELRNLDKKSAAMLHFLIYSQSEQYRSFSRRLASAARAGAGGAGYAALFGLAARAVSGGLFGTLLASYIGLYGAQSTAGAAVQSTKAFVEESFKVRANDADPMTLLVSELFANRVETYFEIAVYDSASGVFRVQLAAPRVHAVDAGWVMGGLREQYDELENLVEELSLPTEAEVHGLDTGVYWGEEGLWRYLKRYASNVLAYNVGVSFASSGPAVVEQEAETELSPAIVVRVRLQQIVRGKTELDTERKLRVALGLFTNDDKDLGAVVFRQRSVEMAAAWTEFWPYLEAAFGDAIPEERRLRLLPRTTFNPETKLRVGANGPSPPTLARLLEIAKKDPDRRSDEDKGAMNALPNVDETFVRIADTFFPGRLFFHPSQDLNQMQNKLPLRLERAVNTDTPAEIHQVLSTGFRKFNVPTNSDYSIAGRKDPRSDDGLVERVLPQVAHFSRTLASEAPVAKTMSPGQDILKNHRAASAALRFARSALKRQGELLSKMTWKVHDRDTGMHFVQYFERESALRYLAHRPLVGKPQALPRLPSGLRTNTCSSLFGGEIEQRILRAERASPALLAAQRRVAAGGKASGDAQTLRQFGVAASVTAMAAFAGYAETLVFSVLRHGQSLRRQDLATPSLEAAARASRAAAAVVSEVFAAKGAELWIPANDPFFACMPEASHALVVLQNWPLWRHAEQRHNALIEARDSQRARIEANFIEEARAFSDWVVALQRAKGAAGAAGAASAAAQATAAGRKSAFEVLTTENNRLRRTLDSQESGTLPFWTSEFRDAAGVLAASLRGVAANRTASVATLPFTNIQTLWQQRNPLTRKLLRSGSKSELGAVYAECRDAYHRQFGILEQLAGGDLTRAELALLVDVVCKHSVLLFEGALADPPVVRILTAKPRSLPQPLRGSTSPRELSARFANLRVDAVSELGDERVPLEESFDELLRDFKKLAADDSYLQTGDLKAASYFVPPGAGQNSTVGDLAYSAQTEDFPAGASFLHFACKCIATDVGQRCEFELVTAPGAQDGRPQHPFLIARGASRIEAQLVPVPARNRILEGKCEFSDASLAPKQQLNSYRASPLDTLRVLKEQLKGGDEPLVAQLSGQSTERFSAILWNVERLTQMLLLAVACASKNPLTVRLGTAGYRTPADLRLGVLQFALALALCFQSAECDVAAVVTSTTAAESLEVDRARADARALLGEKVQLAKVSELVAAIALM